MIDISLIFYKTTHENIFTDLGFKYPISTFRRLMPQQQQHQSVHQESNTLNILSF